jgi:hypothetical protein
MSKLFVEYILQKILLILFALNRKKVSQGDMGSDLALLSIYSSQCCWHCFLCIKS